jgi:2-methylisocitrate lyase-like PEP mutase family enzyme
MGASIQGMAERFRELLEEESIVALPGVYDVFSAMLAERAGFHCVFLSGYGVAASAFGNPDIGLTTLTETVAIARNVVGALRVPVVVDVDNGYGNEDNVRRMIEEIEAAGVAAIQFEDQVSPKRCGHSDQKKVIPLREYMRKLECAMKARRTPLSIVARTDSTDLTDAIRRARTFAAAGAEVTIIDGLRSLDDARRVADQVPGPKQINLIYGGKTPILPLPELAEMGFKVALYSTPALYLVAQHLSRWLRVLHETQDLRALGPESMGFPEFQRLMENQHRTRHERSQVDIIDEDEDDHDAGLAAAVGL